MRRAGAHDVDVLLEAVLTIGRSLELEVTLRRLVHAAVDLVDARYGALGVLGDDGFIARFLTVGLSDDEIRAIGHYPRGHGILGELIRHPAPLRLHDLADDPRAAGIPANHPPMHTFIGVPLRVHGQPFGNLYLTEKRGGGDFTDEDQRLLEGLAVAASVAVENARLYDETRLRERLAHANDAVSRRLLAGASRDEVLDVVAAEALQLADADMSLLAVPDPANPETLVVGAAHGTGGEHLDGTVIPEEGTFAREVYVSGRPVVTADASSHPTMSAAFDPADQTGPLAALPLGEPGRTRGVLTVARRRGGIAFSPVVVEALAGFATQAAVALELAERRHDGERLAVLRDRDRIARDLHDLAIQRLYATGLSLQGVSRRLGDSPEAPRIGRAVDEVDETIGLIRTTIRGLQPGAGRTVGLRARIIAEVQAASGALGFPPALRFDGTVDALVPPVTADHLVAVVRESLSNVARHARATTVDVLLRADGDVVLTVSDDGVGMRDDVHLSGIANLADRARELGGTMAVGPCPDGRGTLVRWQVPLARS